MTNFGYGNHNGLQVDISENHWHGLQFELNYTGLLDRVVGGWAMGAIVTYQTGSPFQMGGGFGTFNDYADGGINLNGVTLSQLQSSVGVHRVSATQNGGSPAAFVGSEEHTSELQSRQYLVCR